MSMFVVGGKEREVGCEGVCVGWGACVGGWVVETTSTFFWLPAVAAGVARSLHKLMACVGSVRSVALALWPCGAYL